jgi:hypothetical protein
MTDATTCTHIRGIKTVKHATQRICDACVKIGRHASAHARASSHAVVASAEPGERWLYCYPDEAFAEY